MTLEQEKQAYYEYEEGKPETWLHKQPPARNHFFEKELERIAGVGPTGKPTLRVRWGGTLMDDRTEETGRLKHRRLAQIQNGYYHSNGKGEYFQVKDLKDIPEGRLALPNWETHQFGKLRWIIERWVSPETLEEHARFDGSLTKEGEKLFRDFPREGVYDHFFTVQTADGKFRDLDNQVLEAVREMWRVNMSAYLQRQIEEERAEKERKEERDAQEEIWNTAI